MLRKAVSAPDLPQPTGTLDLLVASGVGSYRLQHSLSNQFFSDSLHNKSNFGQDGCERF